MLFCQLDDDAGEGDDGDQVRDGHEAVERVGDLPDGLEAHGRADYDDGDIDDFIHGHAFTAEEIFDAACPVE